MTSKDLQQYLNQFSLPLPNSHKGQNGKVMIVGGSELFHAASQWALLIVSRMVDMVFYASIPSNNALIQEAKNHFSNGIVIRRQDIESYIEEANVVLIGPGMEREEISNFEFLISNDNTLSESDWNNNTFKITNYLLHKYPDKKWVVDAGALQMVDPKLLNKKMIITPHQGEFEGLIKKLQSDKVAELQSEKETLELLKSKDYRLNTTILLKGPTDQILSTGISHLESITGGNEGMTKGGTGDVLAGLVAGLYAFCDDPFAVAVVASYLNKKAGDELYETVGPFFNATDLANQLPKTMAKVFNSTV